MRHAICFVLAALLAGAVMLAPASAQAPVKRVGYVVYGASGPRDHLEQALLDGLREQGYVEGRNLVVERRYAEGSGQRLRSAATELAALKLDAIVSTCSPSTDAVKQATTASGTPVIMAVVSDPVGQRLVASLARPGGNVTGRSSQAEDTMPKMLELFAAALPRATRIAVLYNTGNPVHPRLWRALEHAGQDLGLSLMRVDVSSASEYPALFETMVRERLAALLVLPDDNASFNARASLVDLAAKRGIPSFYGAREFVVQGGMMSYGENMAASYRDSALYVAKVLGGTRPSDLPVEQPTRFELVVNAGAAKALGLTIPVALLLRADEVIQGPSPP